MPGHINKLLSQEAKDALQKYNVEAIQKFKTSRNLNETNLIHDVYEHAQDKLPPSIDEEEFQECQEFNTDKDLEPPTDDLLDFITSQEHSDDQLDQILIKHITKLNLKLKLHIDKSMLISHIMLLK